MTAGKITIVLAIAAAIKLLAAQDEALDKQALLQSLVVVRRAEENLLSAITRVDSSVRTTVLFDKEKGLAYQSSISDGQKSAILVEIAGQKGQLLHDANAYLEASAQLRQELLRTGLASRPEKQEFIAMINKGDACAVAAVDYAKAMSAFVDPRKSTEAEIEKAQAARKRFVELCWEH